MAVPARPLVQLPLIYLACAGAALFSLCAPVWSAQGFSFGKAEYAEQQEQAQSDAQRRERIGSKLATPCRAKIKNQKIMVLIAESRNGALQTRQSDFGPVFDAINVRLQALGLKTYTQAQIQKQIAQAEVDAYFKNDPDAALAASKRMAAQYVLRGVINTDAVVNRAINVNQVQVRLDFTLSNAAGKPISQTSAQDASFAGADVRGMALTLVNEQAAEVVAQLYSDYCQQAGR